MSPGDYLLKATRAMASARLLLEAGDSEGACNRAYYAMFDAAHAALIHAGALANPARTKTHQGLITAFGLHLVKTGKMSVDMGKAINQVEQVRLLADYTGEEIDNQTAHWAIDQASVFLDTVRKWLDENP